MSSSAAEERHCNFCGRVVVDAAGKKTDEFGSVGRSGSRHVCARCMKAFEFSLGG